MRYGSTRHYDRLPGCVQELGHSSDRHYDTRFDCERKLEDLSVRHYDAPPGQSLEPDDSFDSRHQRLQPEDLFVFSALKVDSGSTSGCHQW